MCFDYYEYAEFGDEKQVRCRKPHRCSGCRRTIEAGELAKVCTGKFDGDFFRDYVCEGCQRLTYSIAADEIRRGCHWAHAWIALEELAEYLEQVQDIKLLHGSLAECDQQVMELWRAARTAAVR